MECEKVVVIGIYKKNSGKVCSITNSLRSQTKVWKLATLSVFQMFIVDFFKNFSGSYLLFYVQKVVMLSLQIFDSFEQLSSIYLYTSHIFTYLLAATLSKAYL